MTPLAILLDFAATKAESTRHGARPGGRILRAVVYARAPYVPRSREREKNTPLLGGEKAIKGFLGKKVKLIRARYLAAV